MSNILTVSISKEEADWLNLNKEVFSPSQLFQDKIKEIRNKIEKGESLDWEKSAKIWKDKFDQLNGWLEMNYRNIHEEFIIFSNSELKDLIDLKDKK